MNGLLLGFITTGINNWFDSFFLFLLLRHSLHVNKKEKRILFVSYIIIIPVIAATSHLLETVEAVRGVLAAFVVLLGTAVIPLLAARREILRYEICYILNYVGLYLSSAAILIGSKLLGHADVLYFHVNEVSMLPGFFLCNAIYAAISYIIYRLSKIAIRYYREESKVQNIIAFCYFGIMYASGFGVYLQIYSESRLYIQGLAAAFSGIEFASLCFLVFVFYQNQQIRKENMLIMRHREKEMEYYAQLEKNQLAIRKMRHDIMNYFQAVRQISGDGARVRELLDELERQVQEK